MYQNCKLIDAHVHYALPIEYEQLEQALAFTGADKAVLLTVPDRQRILATPEALMIKAHNPDKYFVFTSLDVSQYFKHKKNFGKYMVKYVNSAIKMGCDGVKLIEGKPGIRKMLNIPPFDSSAWAPFWQYAEQSQLPIIWHVNDPQEFWDLNSIPQWAKNKGWHYDDTFVNYQQQYNEVYNVLERYPNLNITFAHFFFLSADLSQLQKILDKYPNVSVDITPGIEMYMNFSTNSQQAREFFIKNAKRIIYGTDIGARAVLKNGGGININECVERSRIIKSFLCDDKKITVKADGDFLIGNEDFELNCLDLPDNVLQDIFSHNFEHLVNKSNKVNKKRIIKECKRIKFTIKIMSLFDKSIIPDYSYANKVIAYFNKK